MMKPGNRRAFQALQLGPQWLPRVQAQPDAPTAPSPGADERPDPAPADRRSVIASLDWAALADQVADCRACGLCQTRTRTVFGVGSRNARWMLIGEAPGAEEDQRGEPFVGKAGRLLDQMLAAIQLNRRDDVFIANVLKCRPPGNRDPLPLEVASCEPYLMRQLQLVDPAIVVLLGRFAAQSMLGSDASIASLRGRLHRIRVGDRQVPAVVTYHPAYLLRNPADKGKVWRDLLLARQSVAAAAA